MALTARPDHISGDFHVLKLFNEIVILVQHAEKFSFSDSLKHVKVPLLQSFPALLYHLHVSFEGKAYKKSDSSVDSTCVKCIIMDPEFSLNMLSMLNGYRHHLKILAHDVLYMLYMYASLRLSVFSHF